MAPKFVLKQNLTKHKLNNNSLKIIARLRKRVQTLSIQNKELSSSRNYLLTEKLHLKNENFSLNISNTQLTTINRNLSEKISLLGRSLQECVPALVTLSQNIPCMLKNVQEISKFSKLTQCNNKKKETITVRPINKPVVSGFQYDLSPIIESPISEQTPRQNVKFNTMKSYVRMKDVAVLLKNSKSVPNENASNKQPENLVEAPSWCCGEENQNLYSNSSLSDILEKSCLDSNETPVKHNRTKHSGVQADMSTSFSNLNDTIGDMPKRCGVLLSPNETYSISKNVTVRKQPKRRSSNTSDMNISTSLCPSVLVSPNETYSMPKNVTVRKQSKRRSSETSNTSEINTSTSSCCNVFVSPNKTCCLSTNTTVRNQLERRSSETNNTSDVDTSTSSTRSKRSTIKSMNYKEKSVRTKLRRE